MKIKNTNITTIAQRTLQNILAIIYQYLKQNEK